MARNHNGNRYDATVSTHAGNPEISATAVNERTINYQQVVKWTVYTLLLLNWALYIREDWLNAQHTLRNGGSLLDWTRAFGTSLDEAAWFGLLFLWELETYALSEHAWTRFVRRLFLAIRGVCYVFLAHTVFAWGTAWLGLHNLEPSQDVAHLCDLSGQGVSYTRNLDYTLIDEVNCAGLAVGAELFFVDNSAVTDRSGLEIERRSAWFDLQDAVTWLLVMFTIEIGIWLQERNITGGTLMLVSRLGKAFYAVLFLDAAYWAWMGHWLYTWDQLLWIGGFWAIEFNLKEWRDAIEAARWGKQARQKVERTSAGWDKIPADSS
jgi:hypothetical protein